MENGQNKPHWWQSGVVYQIYPRSFMDTTGNGVGDLEGVIQKLDYLNDGSNSSLNIDAIWLSPIFTSPMADFGYDVADYCNIDPLFGDLAVFDRLIEQAHRRGIKVIIDYVPNHTSDRHPWFIESRSSRDNPKRDWYIWRDPGPDNQPPNNWGSHFGGPAWTFDEQTQQYYMHQFLPEQPELNWRNPQVKKALLDVLHFWLRRGVDGFRMDVIWLLLKHPGFPDNPLNPDAPPDLSPNDLRSRQIDKYCSDQPGILDIMRDIRRILDSYSDRCAIGEIYLPVDRWVRYYGENGDGLHLPFNFRLIHIPWQAGAIRDSVNELEGALPPFAWPNYVLGNHDQPRLASRIGPAQARTAAMLLLTLRGTPTLYYGDELGLENGIIPPDKIQDPPGRNIDPSHNRDVCRTPMQWEPAPFAGFSTVEPWLPVSDNYMTRNVAVQSDNPASMLNLYRKLLLYRRRTPALQWGSYRPLDIPGIEDACFIYTRSAGEEKRIVALNFTGESQRISIPDTNQGWVDLSTHLDREGKVSLEEIELRPYEGIIIRV